MSPYRRIRRGTETRPLSANYGEEEEEGNGDELRGVSFSCPMCRKIVERYERKREMMWVSSMGGYPRFD